MKGEKNTKKKLMQLCLFLINGFGVGFICIVV